MKYIIQYILECVYWDFSVMVKRRDNSRDSTRLHHIGFINNSAQTEI